MKKMYMVVAVLCLHSAFLNGMDQFLACFGFNGGSDESSNMGLITKVVNYYTVEVEDKGFIKTQHDPVADEYNTIDDEYEKSLLVLNKTWWNLSDKEINQACQYKEIANHKDKNGLPFLLFLIKSRRHVGTIIKIVQDNAVNLDSIYDKEGYYAGYWMQRSFYTFEKNYKTIKNALEKREFAYEKVMHENCIDDMTVKDWNAVPVEVQTEILQNLSLLFKIKDGNGNTLVHHIYAHFYRYHSINPNFFDLISKNTEILKIKNNDDKTSEELIPPIKITSWDSLDPYVLKYMEKNPKLFLQCDDSKKITVDEQRGETYLIYLARTHKPLIDFMESHSDIMPSLINVQDNEGNTMMHCWYKAYYNKYKNFEVTVLCEKYKANFDLKNKDGKTPEQVKQSPHGAIKTWDNDVIANVKDLPEWYQVSDKDSQTLLLYILKNVSLKNTSITEGKKFYDYDFDPLFITKVLKKSDLHHLDSKGQTAFDLLLWGDIFFTIPDYSKAFDTSGYLDRKAYFNIDQKTELFWQLVEVVINRGYDFSQNNPYNHSTTLDSVHERHLQTTYDSNIKYVGRYLPNQKTLVARLLECGINLGTKVKRDDVDCAQAFDACFIEKKALKEEVENNLVNIYTNKENKRHFDILFKRSLARKYTVGIKYFGYNMPSSYSPLKAFEMALENNGSKSVGLILNNFHYTTLINLFQLMHEKPIFYAKRDTGNAKKLYEVYQKGVKSEAESFCQATRNFVGSVAWFDLSISKLNKRLDAVTRRHLQRFCHQFSS